MNFKRGAVEGSTVVIILLSVALVGMGTFGVWAYLQYSQEKSNVDSKVALEVAKAKKEEGDLQEKKYAERAKEPNADFNAPADLGKVRFSYPKTWSSYVDTDGTNGTDYTAYLHPVTVPPVPKNAKTQQRFALRMAIYNRPMDKVMEEYQKTIEKGELSSTNTIANGQNATRLEGLFPSANKDDRIQGVAYFFKVNDKTLMLKSDAQIFRTDFDKLIQTVKFN